MNETEKFNSGESFEERVKLANGMVMARGQITPIEDPAALPFREPIDLSAVTLEEVIHFADQLGDWSLTSRAPLGNWGQLYFATLTTDSRRFEFYAREPVSALLNVALIAQRRPDLGKAIGGKDDDPATGPDDTMPMSAAMRIDG